MAPRFLFSFPFQICIVLHILTFHCVLSCSLFEYRKQAFFVDLFVRVSNTVAVNMYKQLGYHIYRTVLGYYTGDPDEDAYGE